MQAERPQVGTSGHIQPNVVLPQQLGKSPVTHAFGELALIAGEQPQQVDPSGTRLSHLGTSGKISSSVVRPKRLAAKV
jgi:hypothetical protein